MFRKNNIIILATFLIFGFKSLLSNDGFIVLEPNDQPQNYNLHYSEGKPIHRLTNAYPNNSHYTQTAIWHLDKFPSLGQKIDLNKSFVLKFHAYFGTEDVETRIGADGMCFILQNEGTSYYSDNGGALGAGGAGLAYRRTSYNDETFRLVLQR